MARGTEIENARMGSGNDTVIGNAADNRIWGDGGRDRLYGGEGQDRLYGGGGRDHLFGGSQNDRLYGRNGNDYFDSGEGNDLMIGGDGADSFFYGFGHDRDRIRDFTFDSDALVFTALDFGTEDAQGLVDTYARVTARGIQFNFGTDLTSGASTNDRLTLLGIYDLDALVDDIVFV